MIATTYDNNIFYKIWSYILSVNASKNYQASLMALLAPLEVVPGLDNTEGMAGISLGHLAHTGQGVILRVILQYVIHVYPRYSPIMTPCNDDNNNLCHCQLHGGSPQSLVSSRNWNWICLDTWIWTQNNVITKYQYTVIEVHCSRSIHWLGQFGSRCGPASHHHVKYFSWVKIRIRRCTTSTTSH